MNDVCGPLGMRTHHNLIPSVLSKYILPTDQVANYIKETMYANNTCRPQLLNPLTGHIGQLLNPLSQPAVLLAPSST